MNEITIDDVFSLFPLIHNRKWNIIDFGDNCNVIRDEEDRCPLCALAVELGTAYPTISSYSYSFRGLNDYDTIVNNIEIFQNIANAADIKTHWLREQLLESLGIEG